MFATDNDDATLTADNGTVTLPSGCALMEFPAGWTRKTWLEWRRGGIGGSDVAALAPAAVRAGHVWGSPMSLFLDKAGLLDIDAEQPEFMRWGTLLEPAIADEFTERLGLHVVARQALLVDTDHPWRRCTLDGLAAESALSDPRDAHGNVQIKTTGDREWDELPDAYQLQVLWELGLSGFDHGWVPVLHLSSRKLRVYELDASPRTFAALCSIVDRFWHDHVVASVAPPADEDPATTRALKDAYRNRADDSTVELGEETVAIAREWPAAMTRVDKAEAQLAGITNHLRAALGEAVAGSFAGNELVTWRAQKAGGSRLDEKRLRAERPDIYDEYAKPQGTTRVLRATKALRELVASTSEGDGATT